MPRALLRVASRAEKRESNAIVKLLDSGLRRSDDTRADTISLRKVIAGGGVIAAVFAAGSVAAQDWKPAKNVEIVVNSGAGGAADRSARVAQRLLGAVP